MASDTALYQKTPKWVKLICEECSQIYYTPPSRLKRGKKHCSRKCSNNALAKRMTGVFGKNHPNFKNGEYVDKKGYKQILISSPKEIKGGYRYKGEHLVEGEKVLGRKLKKNECVHHIDCDPSNNKNSNLLICERSYHHWLHWEMSRKYGQLILGGP